MATPADEPIALLESDSTPDASLITRPTIAAVSIKLPPYWPADPTVWFAQVEAQFNTRNISLQKTRFEYIIASISPEIAMEVRDLLIRPPTDDPYDTLKTELIKRTAASEQRKLQQEKNSAIANRLSCSDGCNSS